MNDHKSKTHFLSDASGPTKIVTLRVVKMTKKDRVVDLLIELADGDPNKPVFTSLETDTDYEIKVSAVMTAKGTSAFGVAFWREDFNWALNHLEKKWGPRANLEFSNDGDRIAFLIDENFGDDEDLEEDDDKDEDDD